MMSDRRSSSALLGVLYTGIEKIIAHGVDFARGVVLARLLCPEDFGLTAMLGIFLSLAGIFIDNGFSIALVQNRDFTHGDEHRVLVFNVGVAIVLYTLLFFVAPAIAAFYDEPRLIDITRVLSLTLLFNAPSGIASARLQRTQRFGKLSCANVIVSFFFAAFSIVLAMLGCGVWTLVWTAVVGSVVRLALMWIMAWGISAPGKDVSRGAFGDLVRYGWKMAAYSLLSNIHGNLVPLVIGKMQTPTAVGLYSRASSWSVMPARIEGDVIGRVTFPRMAECRNSLDTLRQVRARGAWLGMALLLPVLVVLWLFAAPLVSFVFGDQWLSSVSYLRILLVGLVWWPLANQNGVALGACGRSDYVLQAEMIRRPLGLLLLAGGCLFGIEGLCWAKVAADFVDWMVMSCYMRKYTGGPFLREALSL